MTIDILLDSIIESKTNPRTHFEESELIELAESISKVGVIQAIIVRPIENDTYELVCGARRTRSSKIAGKKTIPANIRNLTDEEALELQITENLQRVNVNPLEEAKGIHDLMNIGRSVYDIAHTIGKSEKLVYQRIALLRLCDEAKKYVMYDQLPIGHAFKISALEEKKQVECLKHILVRDADKNIVSVRGIMELNYWIKNNSIKDLSAAPFDLKDKNLCINAGACVGCPKRTSVNNALFEEYANENKCLDPVCYDSKIKAHVDGIVDRLKDKGVQPVLISDASYGQTKSTLGHLAYEFKEGKKQCESCQLAVIVHSDKGNEGKQAYVCVHSKCPTYKNYEPTAVLDVEESDKPTPTKLQRGSLIIALSRADIIQNHNPEPRTLNFIIYFSMFMGMMTEFQQQVVDSLGWTIGEEEEAKGTVGHTDADEFFFENFRGSQVHIEVISRVYFLDMFLSMDSDGFSGYEPHDTFIKENVLVHTKASEKRAEKFADRLIALHDETPDKKNLKNITPEMLLMAFKTEKDLIMLADKLGMTLDIKEETTVNEIAKIITSWKQ